MPFEFVARNGIIALANSIVTGSVTATQGFTGSLFGTSSWATNAATSSFILNAVSASFAATASSVDNFLVRGTLTAQTIVAQTITSSTDFVTGSTRFGTLLTNTHVFSGSVTMNPGGLFVSGSGLVGIGTTSPALPLTIFNSNAATLYQTAGTGTGGGNGFYVGHTGNVSYVFNYNAFPIQFGTNNLTRMTLDSSGNLGLGVVPSAWTSYVAMELGRAGNSIFGYNGAEIGLTSNAYYNSGWKYGGTGAATLFGNSAGSFSWFNAPSGTAGNAITFTQAMTLGTNSGLSIGTTTAAAANGLLVAGAATFSSSVTISGNNDLIFRDSSTYISSPATDTLRIITANNERLRITSGGNVGIGTTSPVSKLHVVGDGDTVTLQKSNNVPALAFLGTSTNKSVIEGGDTFNFYTGGSSRLYITNGGNVGIGTTSPSARLDIETSSGGYAVVIKNTSAGGDYLKMTGDSGNTAFEFGSGGTGADAFLNMYADNTQKVLVNADGTSYFNGGNVGIGTVTPLGNLQIGDSAGTGGTAALFNGFTGVSHGSLKIYAYGNNTPTIQLSANSSGIGGGTTYFNSGNVGIGTTSPTHQLSVYNVSRDSTTALNAGNSNIIPAISIQSGTGSWASTGNGFAYYYNTANGNLDLYRKDNSTTENHVMTWVRASGNVGIGTTSPGAKLHISSSTVNDALLITTPNNNSSLYPFFLGGATLTSGDYLRANASIIEFFRNGGPATIRTVGSTNNLVLQSATNLIFNTNGANEYARIDSSGNVGIGTTSPGAKLDVSGNVRATSFTGSFSGSLTGLASNATTASYVLNAVSASFATFATTATSATTATAVVATVTGTNSTELVRGNMADNDQFRILVGGTAGNAGFVEIATADDGTEPIHVRQYTGVFSSLIRTATLLDGSGNTSFPGNVGIGTTTPTARLHVSGTTGGVFEVDGAAAVNALYVSASGRIGIGNITPGYTLDVTGNIHSTTTMLIDASNAAYLRGGDDHEWWDINVANTVGLYGTSNSAVGAIKLGSGGPTLYGASGNLGIGTTSPGARLTIAGPLGSVVGGGSSAIRMTNTDTGNYASIGAGIVGITNAGMQLSVDGTSSMVISSGGNVGIGLVSPGYPLEIASTNALSIAYQRTGVSAKKWGFQSDNDSTYWYNITDNVLALTVRNTGLIGIGTTSPGEKLHVVGNIKLNNGNAIYLGDSANNNGGRIYVDTGTNNFYINQANNAPLYFATNNGTKATILGNGNFGIGTTNPSYKLHITETTSADCRLQIENTSTGNAGIEIVGGGGNQYIDFTPVASTDFEGRIIYSSSSDEMQFMTNGVNRFKLNSNGAEVQNGALGVGVAANSTDGRIDASNDIVAYSSDKRLKTNIQSIENPLDKIGKLSGFTYNWNDKAAKLANYDTNESLIGVFAQEVQAVLPEAVKLAPFDNDGNNKSISGENYLTVQYEKIVPLLIEAIKEQQKQIDDLKYLLSQK